MKDLKGIIAAGTAAANAHKYIEHLFEQLKKENYEKLLKPDCDTVLVQATAMALNKIEEHIYVAIAKGQDARKQTEGVTDD